MAAECCLAPIEVERGPPRPGDTTWPLRAGARAHPPVLFGHAPKAKGEKPEEMQMARKAKSEKPEGMQMARKDAPKRRGSGAAKGEGSLLAPSIRGWGSGLSASTAAGESAAPGDASEEEVNTSSKTLTGDERGLDLPRRSDFKDEFELKCMLGEGAFGVVHRCVERESAEEYAVKIVKQMDLHPLDHENLLTEVRLLKALPVHEHIVSLHSSFEEADSFKLVMDLCHGGDLYVVLDDAKQRHRWRGGDYALSDRAAANVGRQLLTALAFCHSHRVVHRDVKPENVLLARPERQARLHAKETVIKLCDFGYATECPVDAPASLRELVGSPDYVAPEVARLEAYGAGVDVWSAGALLFECLRGRAPFAADTERETLKLVKKAELSFDDGWSRISEQGQAFVRHLMQVEGAARPSAEAALHHPWLASDPPESREAMGISREGVRPLGI